MIGPGDLDEYFDQQEEERKQCQQQTTELMQEIMQDLADILVRVSELQIKIMGGRK